MWARPLSQGRVLPYKNDDRFPTLTTHSSILAFSGEHSVRLSQASRYGLPREKIVVLRRSCVVERRKEDGGTELGWIIKSCDQRPVSAGKATVQH